MCYSLFDGLILSSKKKLLFSFSFSLIDFVFEFLIENKMRDFSLNLLGNLLNNYIMKQNKIFGKNNKQKIVYEKCKHSKTMINHFLSFKNNEKNKRFIYF